MYVMTAYTNRLYAVNAPQRLNRWIFQHPIHELAALRNNIRLAMQLEDPIQLFHESRIQLRLTVQRHIFTVAATPYKAYPLNCFIGSFSKPPRPVFHNKYQLICETTSSSVCSPETTASIQFGLRQRYRPSPSMSSTFLYPACATLSNAFPHRVFGSTCAHLSDFPSICRKDLFLLTFTTDPKRIFE